MEKDSLALLDAVKIIEWEPTDMSHKFNLYVISVTLCNGKILAKATESSGGSKRGAPYGPKLT